ncbi:hypothetical protein [Actinomadura gamaensis]|uniref:Uncharacterized protein n=1 Tax=Actinomadura gamaensis TaxID=1763541 RepID=A0ABV9TYY3_9ACTN
MVANTRIIAGSCLVLAPTVQALSTFFWEENRQGITTGTLIMVSTVFWIVGLAQLFRDIEPRVPRYATVAFPLAVYGCLGGDSFGLQGMFEELFGVGHDHAVRLLQEHQAAAFTTFWMAGVLFPTSLFVLGVVLTRIKYVPAPSGILLAVGAVVFPASRIPREVVIAHVADLILILPFAHIGILMLRSRSQAAVPSIV